MSETSIERRMAELRDLAGKYAKAQGQRVYLEEFRKSKLAILMQDAELRGYKTSAAQEREAYGHPDYTDLLMGLKTAVEDAERYRWELKIAEIGAEVWRSQQANQRAERRGYGA